MAAETGIAIIVSAIPFFFVLYAYLMPESRFSQILKPIFFLAGLLFLLFTVNVAYKYAAVESLSNIRDAMEATMLWIERFIYLFMFLYVLDYIFTVVFFIRDSLQQKHG